MVCKDVENRLLFAKKRLEELELLNNGDLAGANEEDRQQLIQEFFFHLVGAIYFLMPFINKSRNLGLLNDEANPGPVYSRLNNSDVIKPILNKLYPQIGRGNNKIPLPQNPYSDEGCHFRILIYRHWVTHERRHPFNFIVGGNGPRTSLHIDLRDNQVPRPASIKPALEELNTFWVLVNTKIHEIIQYL